MPLWVVFICLFLLFAGLCLVFTVYFCLLWYMSFVRRDDGNNHRGRAAPEAAAINDFKILGLTARDLQLLPEGVGAVAADQECSLCLDDIQPGQSVRVLPACGHRYHRHCADTWLARLSACPLCRATVPRLASGAAPFSHRTDAASVAAAPASSSDPPLPPV